VSEYARSNYRNFVAEVFAALVTGREEYNDDVVLRWYDYFGGNA